MLEPALRCETSETVITHFARLRYRCTALVAYIAAVPESSPASIAETYQIPTALTASADRDLEIAAG